MRCGIWLPLAALAGGLCAIPLGMRAIRVGRGAPPPDRTAQRAIPAGQEKNNEEGDAPCLSACPPAGHDRSETERTEQAAVVNPPSTQARERAETGIGRIERIVSERKMPVRAAEVFRTQMANRLAASGADRAVVKAWLDRTVPATPARPVATTAAAAESEQTPFDLSALTPEEREVIGMNANFIHAATHSNTHP